MDEKAEREFAGHTPGPWTLTDEEDIRAGGEKLLLSGVAMPLGVHPRRAEALANARLVTAAPDLLRERDALRALLRKMQGLAAEYLVPDGLSPSEFVNAVMPLLDGPEQRAAETGGLSSLERDLSEARRQRDALADVVRQSLEWCRHNVPRLICKRDCGVAHTGTMRAALAKAGRS